MKNFVVLLSLFCSSYFANAQCTFTSTGQPTNYTVTVYAIPYSITTKCNGGGYTFKINVAYNVTFSPAMPSGGLFTLQGTINCSNQAGTGNIFFDLPNSGGSGTVVSSTASTNKNDCATANQNTLGCNAVSIQISGPGIASQTVNCPIFTLLPVQITDFTASKINGHIEAKWTTASETNNSYFTLEKSKNGVDFLSVKKILSAGNSNAIQRYSAIDTSPFEGTSYYRIKQTDADGQNTYTRLETVKMDAASLQLTIYPNPNSGNQLHFSGMGGASYLELFSATGKKVFTAELKSNEITLPNLPKGMYTLKIISKTSNTSKVLKYLRQ